MAFSMKVEDCFHVGDKIIFSGALETNEKQILNAPSIIKIDDYEEQIIIGGEVSIKGNCRDLWTSSSISLDLSQIRGKNVWITSC